MVGLLIFFGNGIVLRDDTEGDWGDGEVEFLEAMPGPPHPAEALGVT